METFIITLFVGAFGFAVGFTSAPIRWSGFFRNVLLGLAFLTMWAVIGELLEDAGTTLSHTNLLTRLMGIGSFTLCAAASDSFKDKDK